MIPVVPRPEPPDFSVKVRQPGEAFLRDSPQPSAKEFKRAPYWKVALPQLRAAYGDVCAYSSIWIPSNCSVDHFRPKVIHPHLAYEWSNFRLALDRVNVNKGESEDVLDPFQIQVGWFILDSATLFVHPESTLPSLLRNQIQRSIDILKLNDDRLVETRFVVLRGYIDGEMLLSYIERNYPFVAAEIKRQDIPPREHL